MNKCHETPTPHTDSCRCVHSAAMYRLWCVFFPAVEFGGEPAGFQSLYFGAARCHSHTRNLSLIHISPLEVFEQVAQHERRVSKMIDELVDVASAETDKATQDFLWGFVREQVADCLLYTSLPVYGHFFPSCPVCNAEKLGA